MIPNQEILGEQIIQITDNNKQWWQTHVDHYAECLLDGLTCGLLKLQNVMPLLPQGKSIFSLSWMVQKAYRWHASTCTNNLSEICFKLQTSGTCLNSSYLSRHIKHAHNIHYFLFSKRFTDLSKAHIHHLTPYNGLLVCFKQEQVRIYSILLHV